MADLGVVAPGEWTTPQGWSSRADMVVAGLITDYDINIGLRYGPIAPGEWTTPQGWSSRADMVAAPSVSNYIIRMLQLVFRLLWPSKGQRWPLGRVEL